MSGPLLVWGAGGHGRMVAELGRLAGYTPLGFADADPETLKVITERHAWPVIVKEAELVAGLSAGRLPEGIDHIALGMGDNRLRLTNLLRLDGLSTPSLVHPTAFVSPSATIGRASIVAPHAVVHTAAVVGSAVIVNSASVVEHDCVLGDGVHVSPGAILLGESSAGDRAWIGAGATVLPGVHVGADAVVGAGAVVRNDVSTGETVVGVPARALR